MAETKKGICPHMPKNKPCPICGAEWVCLKWQLPKAPHQTLEHP